MRHGAHGRRATTFFRTILPGGHGFYLVRRGGHFSIPLGLCVSGFALVRFRGNDALHRDPDGWLRVSLEKRRAGLAQKIAAHSVSEKHSRREREYQPKR